jgi:hypothetical protein
VASRPAVVANNLRMTKRLAFRRHASLRARIGALDDRIVFVLGSPRSGTTFLARAIGSVPGFLDLGEVPPLKASIPQLAQEGQADAARDLRRILSRARRAGLVGSVRPVEQTPEMAHIAALVPLAYPDARIVHLVRDGRDVVCSLLEKNWLRDGSRRADDAGLAYGAYARFWVEPERRREFESASDARRAAWVWRSYVTAARSARVPMLELRYERVVNERDAVARELAAYLDAPAHALTHALAEGHAASVGRFARDLADEQLADVLAEAGDLLSELGYVSSASA